MNNLNQIKVEIISKYGKDYIYPYCATAKAFCKLLGGQKTLTEDNIKAIKNIGGFTVVQVVKAGDKMIEVEL